MAPPNSSNSPARHPHPSPRPPMAAAAFVPAAAAATARVGGGGGGGRGWWGGGARGVAATRRHGGGPAPPRVAGGGRRRAAGAAGPPVMTWIEKSATVEVEAPRAFCYSIFSDLEAQPQWSPWLKSVAVDAKDPAVSRWTLASRGVEVSWQARNTQVTPGEVIAWRSLDGLPNKGAVTFVDAPRSPSPSPSPLPSPSPSRPPEGRPAAGAAAAPATRVTLAVAFDVPGFIARVLDSAVIGKYVEATLLADLKRYRSVVLKEVRVAARAGAASPQR